MKVVTPESEIGVGMSKIAVRAERLSGTSTFLQNFAATDPESKAVAANEKGAHL